MSRVVENFINELRATCGAEIAAGMAHALDEMDVEAGDNPAAAEFYRGVVWVLANGPSVPEKLDAFARLSEVKKSLTGNATIQLNLRELFGWNE